jgi:hypothetical protein
MGRASETADPTIFKLFSPPVSTDLRPPGAKPRRVLRHRRMDIQQRAVGIENDGMSSRSWFHRQHRPLQRARAPAPPIQASGVARRDTMFKTLPPRLAGWYGAFRATLFGHLF